LNIPLFNLNKNNFASGEMGKKMYPRNPNDFAWNLHMLTSFLGTLIIHPVFETIYESGGHLPFGGTTRAKRWRINTGFNLLHSTNFLIHLPF